MEIPDSLLIRSSSRVGRSGGIVLGDVRDPTDGERDDAGDISGLVGWGGDLSNSELGDHGGVNGTESMSSLFGARRDEPRVSTEEERGDKNGTESVFSWLKELYEELRGGA